MLLKMDISRPTLLWIATLILNEHRVQGIWKPKYDWKGIFNEALILDLLSSCCSYNSRVLGVPDCGSFVDETLSSLRETILKSDFKVVP